MEKMKSDGRGAGCRITIRQGKHFVTGCNYKAFPGTLACIYTYLIILTIRNDRIGGILHFLSR